MPPPHQDLAVGSHVAGQVLVPLVPKYRRKCHFFAVNKPLTVIDGLIQLVTLISQPHFDQASRLSLDQASIPSAHAIDHVVGLSR